MKWFQHPTIFHKNEQIAAYLEETKLEGYGFLCLLMEVVAEKLEGDNNPVVTYPTTTWSRLLLSHPNRVSRYLGSLCVHGVVVVEYLKGSIGVQIPILLNLRDNYSKKYVHPTDRVRPRLQDITRQNNISPPTPQGVDEEGEGSQILESQNRKPEPGVPPVTDSPTQPTATAVAPPTRPESEPTHIGTVVASLLPGSKHTASMTPENLFFAGELKPKQRDFIWKSLCGLPEETAQEMLDQLAYNMSKMQIHSPAAMIQKMVERHAKGEFVCEGGLSIAKAREAARKRKDAEDTVDSIRELTPEEHAARMAKWKQAMGKWLTEDSQGR
ncbi:MAG: hypothetical protein HQL74_13190 [Magnetococcales bacterium]|nr:hypothetical protein [Magnetococcales bacterium]